MSSKKRKKSDSIPRLPEAFVAAMRPRLRDEAEVQAFVAACSRSLPTTLRFNPIRCRAMTEAGEAPALELSLQPLELPATAYRVEGRGDPGRMLEHVLGVFYLQEFVSMIPATIVERLAPALPDSVLDLCAAPGSKTTQLATMLGPEGFIVANEPQGSRAGVLVANLLRAGASRSIVTQMDGRAIGPDLPGFFDVVLVDAPCGGEGTIRKDPKALRGWRPDRNRKLAPIQKELIASGYEALAPGGLLVYSTCTMALAENDEVIEDLLATTDAIEINLGPVFPEIDISCSEQGRLQVFPHHHDSGGFFAAAITKPGRLSPKKSAPLANDEEIASWLRDRYGIDLADEALIPRRHGDDIFLVPRRAGPVLDQLRIRRAGFRAGTEKDGDFVPDHELGLVLGSAFTKSVVELDRVQARRYLAGLQLDLEVGEKPTLLRWQGLPLGFASMRQGRFRNLLPAHFVRNAL